MSGFFVFENKILIEEAASVAGKRESEGPLADKFDFSDESNLFGKESWEEAESEMQRLAYNALLAKTGRKADEYDILISGDLMNQCVAGSYAFSNSVSAYMGIYGACSTFALGLISASLIINTDIRKRVSVITSSHYCSAERQFRTPLEYGSQRTPTAQWTVTGSGAFSLCGEDKEEGVYIKDGYLGRIVDKGINDAANMGAAMAPAAADTLIAYFKETQSSPSDYDMIYTGDLGAEGSKILYDLLSIEGYEIRGKHADCGCIIYDAEAQDMHSGGSGCACSACTFASFIFPALKKGSFKNILFAATGALMSPQFLMQGKTIPSVAHLVHIVKEEEK